jgi:hypothetical protein
MVNRRTTRSRMPLAVLTVASVLCHGHALAASEVADAAMATCS